MSLIDTIKKIVNNVLDNKKLTDVCFGQIVSVDPIAINIGDKVRLSSDFIVVPVEFKEHTVEAVMNNVPTAILVKTSLKINGKVILIRKQGGQQYIVVGSV